MHLTSETIALPPGRAERIFFDDALRGFGLRVRVRRSRSPSGARIIMRRWIVQFRTPFGQRRMTLGDAEIISMTEARKRARAVLTALREGKDPAEDRHLLRAQKRIILNLRSQLRAAGLREAA
jgi:Arm DNA-binding domain